MVGGVWPKHTCTANSAEPTWGSLASERHLAPSPLSIAFVVLEVGALAQGESQLTGMATVPKAGVPDTKQKSLTPAHSYQVKKLGFLRWAIIILPNHGHHLKAAEHWMLALLTFPSPKIHTCAFSTALPSTYDGQVLQNRDLPGERLVVLVSRLGQG